MHIHTPYREACVRYDLSLSVYIFYRLERISGEQMFHPSHKGRTNTGSQSVLTTGRKSSEQEEYSLLYKLLPCC